MPSKILSVGDVKRLISQGKVIVIYKKDVLNLTAWLARHPGGDKAVFHMVGKDATDEMLAYHSEETIQTFSRWKVGEIDLPWENLLPPIQGGDFGNEEESSDNFDDESDLSVSDNSCESEATSVSDIESIEKHSELKQQLAVTRRKQEHIDEKVLPAGKPSGSITPGNITVNKHIETKLYPQNNSIRDPSVLMDIYETSQIKKDVEIYPSLDYETQNELREKYYKLHEKVTKLGFYQCDYWSYFKEGCRIVSLLLYSAVFFKTNHLFLSAFTLGCAWQQMTFIAHDAGHISITHNYQIDNLIGMTIADWVGGLSLGWWKRNHNVHHLITNDPIHDPDIQHLPFFAVSTKLFNNVYSTYYEKYLYFDCIAKFMIRFQNYTYYPILAFGRFNLYRLSWTHLLLGEGPKKGKAAWFRYYELVGLSFFFYWFFYLLITKSLNNGWDRFQYIAVSHITTMIVHVQITLSHFAMSTSDLGTTESFVARQLRTTMDVDCPEWFDYFHGGLQFQAIHHLFPRMPRHNLRAIQPYVIEFCNDVGLSYSIYGFGKGNKVIIGKLREIAQQCSIMMNAAKKLKQEDLYH